MKNKRVGIIQSNYIPWKGYFDFINSVDEFVLLDDVQYTRRDWRNRNLIKCPSGVQWLTIPVEVKGKYDQLINDTLVAEDDWAAKHWKTLCTSYKKAASFEEVYDFFAGLYGQISSRYLSEINFYFIKAITAFLKIDTPIRWSSEFLTPEDRNLRLISICKELNASSYLSGPSAKSYIDEEAFSSAGISVEWMDYSGYLEYPQLFRPFAHGVSIVDLIFNTGSACQNYMKSFKS